MFLMNFRFLEDLEEGVFIQQTLESVLHNEDGKQLLVMQYILTRLISVMHANSTRIGLNPVEL